MGQRPYVCVEPQTAPMFAIGHGDNRVSPVQQIIKSALRAIFCCTVRGGSAPVAVKGR
jgi:hypothetical protein